MDNVRISFRKSMGCIYGSLDAKAVRGLRLSVSPPVNLIGMLLLTLKASDCLLMDNRKEVSDLVLVMQCFHVEAAVVAS